MKVILFFSISLFIDFGAFAQEIDSTEEVSYPEYTGRDEVGYMFMIVNTSNALTQSAAFSPVYEFLSEVRYRHRFNAISLRLYFAYYWKSLKLENPLDLGEVKEPRIGSGIQYNPFKNNEWIYLFIDAGYRHRKEGLAKPMTLNKENQAIVYTRSKVNAFEITPGIGTKIRIYGSLHFTADVGYNWMFGQQKIDQKDYVTWQKFPDVKVAFRFQTWTAKVGLSLTF